MNPMRHRVAKLLHRIGIHVACHVGYEATNDWGITAGPNVFRGTREVHS